MHVHVVIYFTPCNNVHCHQQHTHASLHLQAFALAKIVPPVALAGLAVVRCPPLAIDDQPAQIAAVVRRFPRAALMVTATVFF
jgi:hypothetical protein